MQSFLSGYQQSKAGSSKDAPQETNTDLGQATVSKPWVEKYRPKTIDDVAHQDEVVKVLRNCIKNPTNFPNLLFYGKPGTGKTSAILAVAKQLFGSKYKQRVLELNASDERGIQVIREKVKTFSQLACQSDDSDLASSVSKQPAAPFKLVILDEADSMTTFAQSALRRTMEKQSKNTRFCLICNYVSRIIDPITSRCMKFRFESLPSNTIKERLSQIANKEGIQILSDDVYTEIIKITEGDMRKSITLLQSASRFSSEVDAKVVHDLAGVVPQATIDSFISTSRAAATSQEDYSAMKQVVSDVIMDGYPANQVLSQLANILLADSFYSDVDKAKIFERIAIADQKLNNGANEYLQLLDLANTLLVVNKECAMES